MSNKYALIVISLLTLSLSLTACSTEDDGPSGGDGSSSGSSNGSSSGNNGGSNGGSNGGGSGSGNNGSVSVSLTANPQSGTIPFEVTLRADADNENGGNIAYRWTVPRGNVRAGSSYKVLVTEAGAQTFSVTASNGGDRATANVTVQASEPTLELGNDRPVLDNDVQTNPSEGTSPLTVTFTARASDPNGDSLDYIWDFGDGGEPVGGGATITHAYEEPSYYPVQVFVSDGRGGVDIAYTEVDVSSPPATINLDVTPDSAAWEVESDYYIEDEYPAFSDSGTGDATLTVPAYDFYDVNVSADGYESGSATTEDRLEPGDTTNLSVVLEPVEDTSTTGGDTTGGETTGGTTTSGSTTDDGSTTTGGTTDDGGATGGGSTTGGGTTTDGSTTGDGSTTTDGTTTGGTTTDGSTTGGGTTDDGGTTGDSSTTGDGSANGGTTGDGSTTDGGTTGGTTGG